jgi:hypothetical protein
MSLKPSDLNSVKSRASDKPSRFEVPPLDAKPVVANGGLGVPMSVQADLLRDPTNPLSPRYDPEARRRAMMETMGPSQGSKIPKVPTQDIVEGFTALADFNEKAREAAKKGEEKIIAEQVQEQSVTELRNEVDDFLAKVREEMKKADDGNEDLRKAIEARCSPLSIEQLLDDGEIRQEVPIIRGKFIVTYRTYGGDEDLAVKRLIFGVNGSDVYIQTLMGMYQLTLGLYAINDSILPTHLNAAGEFDKNLFEEKFYKIKKYPLPLLGSVALNFKWFDERSRRMFVDVDELKNG